MRRRLKFAAAPRGLWQRQARMSARCFLFVLAVLGVWRLTHLVYAEHGPWRCLDRVRSWAFARLGLKLFDCFYCLSLWVAAPFAWLLAAEWRERFLLWLACSAGAILVERLTGPGLDQPAPAQYWEDPETEGRNGLLHEDRPVADVGAGHGHE